MLSLSSSVAAIMSPTSWQVLLSIIFVNILLSGDNAVVIAMATRNLPHGQQKSAIFWGCAAAIALRIALIVAAAQLLVFPYVKMVGSILLLYIGIQLLAESDDDIPKTQRHHSKLWRAIRRFAFAFSAEDDKDATIKGHSNMWGAIRTILAADLVMSLDNIIAVAAAAQKAPANSRLALLFVGLGISIPVIVFASTMLVKLMRRFHIIIFLGAGFLGFLAGELLAQEPALSAYNVLIFEAAGAALVLSVGSFLR
jgi:predicted tellurium resistance membrane protein TerC